MQTNRYSFHSSSVSDGVHFLGMLFNAGFSYSTICLERSALLSCLDCKDTASTWDVDIVLHYPHDKLTLKELSS